MATKRPTWVASTKMRKSASSNTWTTNEHSCRSPLLGTSLFGNCWVVATMISKGGLPATQLLLNRALILWDTSFEAKHFDKAVERQRCLLLGIPKTLPHAERKSYRFRHRVHPMKSSKRQHSIRRAAVRDKGGKKRWSTELVSISPCSICDTRQNGAIVSWLRMMVMLMPNVEHPRLLGWTQPVALLFNYRKCRRVALAWVLTLVPCTVANGCQPFIQLQRFLFVQVGLALWLMHGQGCHLASTIQVFIQLDGRRGVWILEPGRRINLRIKDVYDVSVPTLQ